MIIYIIILHKLTGLTSRVTLAARVILAALRYATGDAMAIKIEAVDSTNGTRSRSSADRGMGPMLCKRSRRQPHRRRPKARVSEILLHGPRRSSFGPVSQLAASESEMFSQADGLTPIVGSYWRCATCVHNLVPIHPFQAPAALMMCSWLSKWRRRRCAIAAVPFDRPRARRKGSIRWHRPPFPGWHSDAVARN